MIVLELAGDEHRVTNLNSSFTVRGALNPKIWSIPMPWVPVFKQSRPAVTNKRKRKCTVPENVSIPLPQLVNGNSKREGVGANQKNFLLGGEGVWIYFRNPTI